jgi:hypothetical protein
MKELIYRTLSKSLLESNDVARGTSIRMVISSGDGVVLAIVDDQQLVATIELGGQFRAGIVLPRGQ